MNTLKTATNMKEVYEVLKDMDIQEVDLEEIQDILDAKSFSETKDNMDLLPHPLYGIVGEGKVITIDYEDLENPVKMEEI